MSDIYDSVRDAVAALAEAGQGESAARLKDVMLAGATPTEVLMGVRWAIGQILQDHPDLPKSLSGRLEALRTEISKLLNHG